MILLPPALRLALRANDIARRAAVRDGKPEPDAVPVVKFFSPVGGATWLATELDRDGDTLFGLADMGFGYPELGSYSLRDLTEIVLPFGLRVERDLHFDSVFPLAVWAEAARQTESLMGAERMLATLQKRNSELPPSG